MLKPITTASDAEASSTSLSLMSPADSRMMLMRTSLVFRRSRALRIAPSEPCTSVLSTTRSSLTSDAWIWALMSSRLNTARPSPEVAAPTAGGTRKPARYGLSIQFEPQPGDPELARLVETTVWINEAHPAYRRAMASRSEGYHIALGTAMALAPLAVEPAKEHAFLTTFLAAWGAALERRGARRRK